MANVIEMPLLSDTMEEGVVAEVFFKVGDTIKGGEVLAEVETDKATMEVEVWDEHAGTILHMAGVGDTIPVGAVLAVTGEPGENVEDLLAKAPKPIAAENDSLNEKVTAKEVSSASVLTSDLTQVVSATSSSRVKASPLAKKLANEKGLTLAQITGTGPEGRIIRRDVETAENAPTRANSAMPTASVHLGEEQAETMRVSQMRKIIAKRLAESKYSAPHFYLTIEVNMDKAINVRKEMNEISPVKISFNDLVIKAAAVALRQHRMVNASWMGDTIQKHQHIHVGMAVAVPDGLVVPVLRFADKLTLSELAAETKSMAQKAKEKNLGLEEMQGSTFSVSNLGMFGIDEFTAIINPPNSAILAIGSISKKGRMVESELKAVSVMKVTLSCDHRVVDGATGSLFLNTFKKLLENPVNMLV